MLKQLLIGVLLLYMLPMTWAQQRVKPDSLKQPLDMFLEAERYKMIEDYTQAKEYYSKTLDLDKNYDPAMFELGRICLMQRRYDEALLWIEKAYAEDPNNKWYGVYLSDLYKANGQFAEARKVYEHLLENEPQNAEYLHSLLEIYKQEGKTKKALQCLDKLEKIEGASEAIAFEKRDIYLQEGKQDKAVEAIKALHLSHPQEAKYCNMIAEMYMKNEQSSEALKWYKKVLEINPKDPYINITLADYYKNIQAPDSAFYYLKAGCANPELPLSLKVQMLGELMDKSTVIANKDTRSPLELAEILVNTHPEAGLAHAIYGNMLFADSLFARAKPELAFAIEHDSTNYRVWDQMLLTLGQLEDYPALVNYSQRAMRLFPNMVFPYYMNALSNFLTKNMRAAITTSRLGARISPSDELSEQFYMIMGDAYHDINRNDSAFIAYEKCLKIKADNPIVLNNYAYYLALESKDLNKAEQMAAKAIEIDPNPNNVDTYAWVLFKLKRYEEAETYILKVLRKDKSPSKEVLSHAGDIFLHVGKTKKALKYWGKALELSPQDSVLQQKINNNN
ncbi:MAG: hypothetical protein CSB02_00490 [Bacteroidia bacterium]|nr:MAG: hypothetical protein CSB02_00490 [Bacteroidia bacterium]